MTNIARSVVDERQPFFKVEKVILTVNERLKIEKLDEKQK